MWRWGDTDGLDGVGGDADEANLYYYDAKWRLLEERIDDQLDPGEGAFSGFSGMDRVVQRFWSHRYIDEILYMREDTRDSTGAVGADGDFFNAAGFYFLCDRKYDVIAALRDNGAASLVERVRYTPYGVARHEPASDMDGDGSVSGAELLAILTLSGTPFSSPNYNPDLDADRNGALDNTDFLAVLSSFAGAIPEGKVSTVHNIIAYSGYVYDEAVDLNLARNRWFDASMGRWLNRDPIGYYDSADLYESVLSSPFTYVDPLGLNPFTDYFRWFHRGYGELFNPPPPPRPFDGFNDADPNDFNLDLDNPYDQSIDDVQNAHNEMIKTAGDELAQAADDLGYTFKGAATGVVFGIILHFPPKAIKGLRRVKSKGKVPGTGIGRRRWLDKRKRIYEWDYRHGHIEVYDKTGKKHLGTCSPNDLTIDPTKARPRRTPK